MSSDSIKGLGVTFSRLQDNNSYTVKMVDNNKRLLDPSSSWSSTIPFPRLLPPPLSRFPTSPHNVSLTYLTCLYLADIQSSEEKLLIYTCSYIHVTLQFILIMVSKKLAWTKLICSVEPVIFLYAFGMLMHQPVIQQFIYYRVSEMKNFTYDVNKGPMKACDTKELNGTSKALERQVLVEHYNF